MDKFPKPDKEYRCGIWRIGIYQFTQTAICTRNDGMTYIIRGNTEIIRNLPEYVKEFLFKQGFLREWQEAQIQKSLQRLKVLVTKIANLDQKREQPKDVIVYP